MSHLSDKVTCLVCSKQMSTINNRHLASHGLTADEYRARFPGAPLLSEASQSKLTARSVKSNAARKGQKRSEADLVAIREGIARRESRKGIARGPMPEETKAKLSTAHKARFAAGAKHPRAGKTLGEGTKAKIAFSLRGRKVGSGPARKAIATKIERGLDIAIFRGRTHSDESKAKIAASSKARFEQTRAETRTPMLDRMAASGVTLLNRLDDPVFHFRCNTCAHEFFRTPQMFQPSKWHPMVCDQCHPISKVSDAENELADFISSLVPETRVLRSAMDVIPKLELDIYLPERHIAIEYCGLYWHSEIAGKKPYYHHSKLGLCEKAGIRLVTIFEDEWLTKRPVVEAMLRNLLGRNERKINARSCQVVKLDSATANAFLNNNHIQGRGRSVARYGLMHDGELVSVMTFQNSEISRKMTGWEINRFCSALGVTVRGAASRLFKAFVRDHDPHKVTSYADARWGTGAVYAMAGFKLEGWTVPNYWYFRANELKRYHRYGLRKTADDPPGQTEWTTRKQQGWNRIFDCGHKKWVWTAN